ncbi:hypothetical protein ACFE04_027351 [Oxalis oulophora]
MGDKERVGSPSIVDKEALSLCSSGVSYPESTHVETDMIITTNPLVVVSDEASWASSPKVKGILSNVSLGFAAQPKPSPIQTDVPLTSFINVAVIFPARSSLATEPIQDIGETLDLDLTYAHAKATWKMKVIAQMLILKDEEEASL